MNDETKKPETGGESTAPAKDTGTAPQSDAKPKAKAEDKAKSDKPAHGNVLHSAGLDACKRHGIAEVWVTADGQSFGQESDAKAHSANLNDKQNLNVTAE